VYFTRSVGERFEAGTEDAPVLEHPAPLRRPHDSDARYKYPDLVTYLHFSSLLRKERFDYLYNWIQTRFCLTWQQWTVTPA